MTEIYNTTSITDDDGDALHFEMSETEVIVRDKDHYGMLSITNSQFESLFKDYEYVQSKIREQRINQKPSPGREEDKE